MTERRLLGKHGGEYHGSAIGAFGVVLENVVVCREYTVLDRINFFRGIFQSVDALYPELSRADLFKDVPEVAVPVYFCLGRHDHEVPSVLAARYFEVLKAPRKQLVWFEDSAHMPNIEERDKFNRFVVDTVLPALPASAYTDIPINR
jgi:pimeloyl-ACP methyl ester carboxylesterase